MIHDEEDLLRAIQEHVKANLNAKITAINTEKGDFEIDTITADDVHYVFAGELLDLPNHTFVNFSIDGTIEVNHSRGNLMTIPPFFVEVVFDNPKDANTYFKALRYTRALYETMLEFDSMQISDVQITKVQPILAEGNKRQLVISGVGVSCAICS